VPIPQEAIGLWARNRKAVGAVHLFVRIETWLRSKFADEDRGAGLVEYILLVALIALAVIAAVIFLRTQVGNKFSDAGSKLSNGG